MDIWTTRIEFPSEVEVDLFGYWTCFWNGDTPSLLRCRPRLQSQLAALDNVVVYYNGESES